VQVRDGKPVLKYYTFSRRGGTSLVKRLRTSKIYGANGEGRTPMPLRALEPKPETVRTERHGYAPTH
jgi:hypothetical protein